MVSFLGTLFPVRLSDRPAVMTDLMVDIETTGTNPYHNAMIQLAAIPFNYETQEIGAPFNRCLEIPRGRYWDESTRQWWGQQKAGVLQGIIGKAEDHAAVINQFFDFVKALNPDTGVRFWSRGSFDWWFVQSYMDDQNLPMPFPYWAGRDLRSFMAGLNNGPNEPDMSFITAEGDAHNALFDCVIQLKRLFSAANGVWHEIVEGEVVA